MEKEKASAGVVKGHIARWRKWNGIERKQKQKWHNGKSTSGSYRKEGMKMLSGVHDQQRRPTWREENARWK